MKLAIPPTARMTPELSQWVTSLADSPGVWPVMADWCAEQNGMAELEAVLRRHGDEMTEPMRLAFQVWLATCSHVVTVETLGVGDEHVSGLLVQSCRVETVGSDMPIPLSSYHIGHRYYLADVNRKEIPVVYTSITGPIDRQEPFVLYGYVTGGTVTP